MCRRFQSLELFALIALTGLRVVAAPLECTSAGATLSFDGTNGTFRTLATERGALFGGDTQRLWSVLFRDGSRLEEGAFSSSRDGDALRLEWRAPAAAVTIRVRPVAEGFDLTGVVAPATQDVIELELPARFRFDPASLRRFVTPTEPHVGVGLALNRAFFEPQSADDPAGYKVRAHGPGPCSRLLPGGLHMLELNQPPEPVRATEQGHRILGEDLVARLTATTADVQRPTRTNHTDLVLLETSRGALLSASRLGGTGALWRWGGSLDRERKALAGDAIVRVLQSVAGTGGTRRVVAFVQFDRGPVGGPWSNLDVDDWRAAARRAVEKSGLTLRVLRSPAAVRDALRDDAVLAVLNPYGEAAPARDKAELEALVDAVGVFVRGGGHWIETGGYSFYSALEPQRFLDVHASYPPLFSDFVHLDTAGGSVAIYGVQPRNWEPWTAATNRDAVFIPGHHAYGGAEDGGWFGRSFAPYVKAGTVWTSPVQRIAIGRYDAQNIAACLAANGITRRLADKLPAGKLDTLRRSVLLKFAGSAREMRDSLDALPVPTLLHTSDYLHGGFDKQYPDHLPPNDRFGTLDELKDVFREARARGHLVMPYTNPTWWCDEPRGPTFERAGEAPLVVTLDGSHQREQYGPNPGWTTTFWHPAVQAANRETRRQFTRDVPVDVLFQDQNGARGWHRDFNSASPRPDAYTEGLLSMVGEDARIVPLATEDGWDRVLDGHVQFCGFTFPLGMPGKAYAPELKRRFPPYTWSLYPFAQRAAQDKVMFLHHDLGRFVMDDRTMAWTLGLGFNMSYVADAHRLRDERSRAWLEWLARVQRSVCAQWAGQRLAAFAHEQGTNEDGFDGAIRATHGAVQLVTNLDPQPRRENGRELASYGWLATARGLRAGHLRELGGVAPEGGLHFVAEQWSDSIDVWWLARPDEETAAELPDAPGRVTLTFDGQPAIETTCSNGFVHVRTPKCDGDPAIRRVWHARIAPLHRIGGVAATSSDCFASDGRCRIRRADLTRVVTNPTSRAVS